MHSRAVRATSRCLLTIRPLAPGDARTVASILARCCDPGVVEPGTLATVDSSHQTLIVFVEGDPAPAALGQLVRVTEARAELTVVVADGHRRKGIESALVDLLAADARAAGLGGVESDDARSARRLPALTTILSRRSSRQRVGHEAAACASASR